MNARPLTSFAAFAAAARLGTMVPVYAEVLADTETPVSVYLKLAAGERYAYLLESVEGGERWARYSFIATRPKLVFKARDNAFSVTAPGAPDRWVPTRDPLSELKELMGGYAAIDVPGLPRFWGGAVGYATYDVVRHIECLPHRPPQAASVPDMLFLITDLLVVFDHLTHTVKIIKCVDTREVRDLRSLYRAAQRDIVQAIRRIRAPLPPVRRVPCRRRPVTSNMTRGAYGRMVNRAKAYIRAGDIIQTVLSQRFSRRTSARSIDIYRALRLINPSPYMYHIAAGDFSIIGSSPEILVRKEDGRAETRPIAGTRPRAVDPSSETALETELLADPKERAEHIMLVDLGRNDLGRVCVPKTVAVPDLMGIEKYSHVMHIVSSVTGTLRPGIDAFELFKACFPAGTVSGAPKVRAMQIIDELEPSARGPYAGAIGYVSFTGNMDMAITIRTIILSGGVATAQAGAGIVADSMPAREYRETQNKAAALFAAIDRAEEGLETFQ